MVLQLELTYYTFVKNKSGYDYIPRLHFFLNLVNSAVPDDRVAICSSFLARANLGRGYNLCRSRPQYTEVGFSDSQIVLTNSAG